MSQVCHACRSWLLYKDNLICLKASKNCILHSNGDISFNDRMRDEMVPSNFPKKKKTLLQFEMSSNVTDRHVSDACAINVMISKMLMATSTVSVSLLFSSSQLFIYSGTFSSGRKDWNHLWSEGIQIKKKISVNLPFQYLIRARSVYIRHQTRPSKLASRLPTFKKIKIKHTHIKSCKKGKIKTVTEQFVYCHCCFGAQWHTVVSCTLILYNWSRHWW